MKRSFPRVVSAVAGSFVALLVLGSGCEPNNNVKPGAPLLTSFLIVDPMGAATVASGTLCPSDLADGMDCDPMAVTTCQIPGAGGAAPSYCHCDAKPAGDPTIMPEMPKSLGTAGCASSFDAGSTIIAVFDRLIDPAPFDVPDGSMPTGIADVTPAAALSFAYTANGIANGLLFQPAVFGSPPGPNISISAAPDGFATDAMVVLTLSKTKILAKDGKTPFQGTGLLLDGILTFKTNPPPPPPTDGGTD